MATPVQQPDSEPGQHRSVPEQQAPLWEQLKENAAPLERGRNVSVLERSFASRMESSTANSAERNETDQMTQQYERLVRPLEEGRRVEESSSDAAVPADAETGEDFNKDDPLVHWLKYIKHQQDAYPSDTHRHFLLLERCFRSMCQYHQYDNDPRFIRVCCLYASKTNRTHEIFQYLYSHRIGLETPCFWGAWAWACEKEGDYKRADDIFTEGLRRESVQPKQWLQQRHRQFLRRMSRHFLNTVSIDDEEEGGENGRRGSLGSLTEEAFRRNDRTATGSSSGIVSGSRPNHQSTSSRLSTFTVRSRTSEGEGAQQTAAANAGHSAKGFAIFVEDNNENNNGLGSFVADGSERRLEREEERIKENQLAAERWNQRGGLHPHTNFAASTHHPRARPLNPSSSTFDVYFDEDCAARANSEENVRQRYEDQQRRHRDERTFREKRDGGVAERLANDPLRYIRDPAMIGADQRQDEIDPASRVEASGLDISRASAVGQNTKTSTAAPFKVKREKKTPTIVNPAFCLDLLKNSEKQEERCFEEAREQAKYYVLAPVTNDINLFEREQNDSSSQMDVSMVDSTTECMSMEALDANKMSSRRASCTFVGVDSLHCPSSNSSRTNRTRFSLSYDKLTPRNASAASSTVDEMNAAGAPSASKEEQTINTQWALKELSMMFSSPALPPGVDDAEGRRETALNRSGGTLGPILNESGVSEPAEGTDDGETASFNDIEELLGNHLEDGAGMDAHEDTPAVRHVQGDGAGASAASAVRRLSSAPSSKGFHIFDDESSLKPSSLQRQPKFRAAAGSTFQIYSDGDPVSSQHANQSAPPGRFDRSGNKSTERIPAFSIYNEEDVGVGDTASLSVLGDALAGLGVSDSEQEDGDEDVGSLTSVDLNVGSLTSDVSKCSLTFVLILRLFPSDLLSLIMSNPFRPTAKFITRSSSASDLLPAFGDVSCIAPEDEPTTTVGLAVSKAIAYTDLHQSDVKTANVDVKSRAQGHLPKGSLTDILSMKGVICDCPTEIIPRAFKLNEIVSRKDIQIGRCSAAVENELGRGAYGVVALLRQANDPKLPAVAVKVQKPAGCLPWEYVIMRRIEERLSQRRGSYYPFPRPLSFVFLADGALLGMSAASASGLNIVDLVNIHQLRLGGYVPEILALHYTARMLTHLETLHWHAKVLVSHDLVRHP